jgi:hypothetical protein
MTSKSLLVASELADKLRMRPVSLAATSCRCGAGRDRSNGSPLLPPVGDGAVRRVITDSRG